MLFRSAMIGSFEILIGPLDEILRGLFEIVMMAKSSALSTEFLMAGFFSNRISRLSIRRCIPFLSFSHPSDCLIQPTQSFSQPGKVPTFNRFLLITFNGVVNLLTEAMEVVSSTALTPLSCFDIGTVITFGVGGGSNSIVLLSIKSWILFFKA